MNAPSDEEDVAPPERGPLRSREVFLDTEIYRQLGFDAEHPSFMSLRVHVNEDRLALHLTDITQQEVERQLSLQAHDAMEKIGRARANLAKWRARAPKALGAPVQQVPIDGQLVAREAVNNFTRKLRPFMLHVASARSGADIFKAYFERRAPFDGKSVKEFPDAFVIEALEYWCTEQNTRMYVVTADKAMRRAALATSSLIPLATLDELLEAATIEHSPDVLETVAAILDRPDFIDGLTQTIDNIVQWAGIVYVGDLNEGEAEGVERVSDPLITDWTVISAEAGSYGLIIEVAVDLLVQVHFKDLSHATYDHEDGRYYGAVSSAVQVAEDGATIRLFAQVSDDGTITREESLTDDIEVYGEVDWYK